MTLETQVGLMTVSILRDMMVEYFKTYADFNDIPMEHLNKYMELNSYIQREKQCVKH